LKGLKGRRADQSARDLHSAILLELATRRAGVVRSTHPPRFAR
jgi:hypothetical protein